jgi:hypothetical protein
MNPKFTFSQTKGNFRMQFFVPDLPALPPAVYLLSSPADSTPASDWSSSLSIPCRAKSSNDISCTWLKFSARAVRLSDG